MSESLFFYIGINALLAWSVYVIHLAGSLSFANGAFMGLGAYLAGVLTVKFGVPLWLALAATTVCAAIFGAVVSYPSLRTRGVYLIMMTVGLTFLFQVAVQNMDFIGGIMGMGGMTGTRLWHVIALDVIVAALLYWLSRSHLQRVLEAIREDESVAASLGIDTVYLKVVCFAAGAALAALAGGLYSHYMVFINPDHFSVMTAIYVVLYMVLGGVNNMWGPLLGAVVMTALPEMIRGMSEWRPMVFGVTILVLLLVRPNGLLPFRYITARIRHSSRKQRPGEGNA